MSLGKSSKKKSFVDSAMSEKKAFKSKQKKASKSKKESQDTTNRFTSKLPKLGEDRTKLSEVKSNSKMAKKEESVKSNKKIAEDKTVSSFNASKPTTSQSTMTEISERQIQCKNCLQCVCKNWRSNARRSRVSTRSRDNRKLGYSRDNENSKKPNITPDNNIANSEKLLGEVNDTLTTHKTSLHNEKINSVKSSHHDTTETSEDESSESSERNKQLMKQEPQQYHDLKQHQQQQQQHELQEHPQHVNNYFGYSANYPPVNSKYYPPAMNHIHDHNQYSGYQSHPHYYRQNDYYQDQSYANIYPHT